MIVNLYDINYYYHGKLKLNEATSPVISYALTIDAKLHRGGCQPLKLTSSSSSSSSFTSTHRWMTLLYRCGTRCILNDFTPPPRRHAGMNVVNTFNTVVSHIFVHVVPDDAEVFSAADICNHIPGGVPTESFRGSVGEKNEFQIFTTHYTKGLLVKKTF